MSSEGISLTDDDRWPWLSAIRDHCSSLACELKAKTNANRSYVVITCSALKRSYRDYLRHIANIDRTVFINPSGSFELIYSRISQRANHFMKPEMLNSQFAAFEPPTDESDVFSVDVSQPTDRIIEQILSYLGL